MTETLAAFLAALALLVLNSGRPACEHALEILGRRLCWAWPSCAARRSSSGWHCAAWCWSFRPTAGAGAARGLLVRLGRGAGDQSLGDSQQRVFHKPIITTTHGGYTLSLGNNPQFYRHLSEQGWFVPLGRTDFHARSPMVGFPGEEEIDLDRQLYAASLRNDPRSPACFWSRALIGSAGCGDVCPLATDPNESYAQAFAASCGRAFLSGRVRAGRLGGLARRDEIG